MSCSIVDLSQAWFLNNTTENRDKCFVSGEDSPASLVRDASLIIAIP